MGAGGRMNVSSTPEKDLDRVPITKPPFGLSDLKKAIPPHCFKRSLVRSFATLFLDIAITYTFYYLASNYIPLLPPTLSYVAWPLYWFCQGCMLMGLWVMGHECSHHAFSEYQWIDDTVGFLIHSTILTPYFSFKYSHRSHHAHTNSMEYDEVYVPRRKSNKVISETLNSTWGGVFKIVFSFAIGFPSFLWFNLFVGREYEGFASHFYPPSPIFKDRERPYVLLSDIGIISSLYALYYLAATQGVTWTFCICCAPLFALYAIFLTVTYLNHTHLSIPHYDSTEWDWLRGSLATIDRDFGLFNTVFHHLTDAHVVHHFFPSLPHYHGVEATKAIKPILGKYYKFDDTPMFKALWREITECVYVEPDEGAKEKGVYWFYK